MTTGLRAHDCFHFFRVCLQLHFADEAACRWQWYRQRAGSSAWEELQGATSRRYLPTPEDEGCRLRVRCTPGRHSASVAAGPSADGQGVVPAANAPAGQQAPAAMEAEGAVLGVPGYAETGPVAAPPSPAASAHRHLLTGQRTSAPELRVVSYNILADQYAATETAKNVIFAHCPPQ
jgi:2',5'-phosphodiesterase